MGLGCVRGAVLELPAHPRRSLVDPWQARGKGHHSGPRVIVGRHSLSASRGLMTREDGHGAAGPHRAAVCMFEGAALRLLRIWAASSFICSVQSLRAMFWKAGRAGSASLATSLNLL